MLLRKSAAAVLHQVQLLHGLSRSRNFTFTAPTCARAVATVPAEPLPRHVVLVMDGNSRWASARGLPPTAGHERGLRALAATVRLSRAWGIRALIAFLFSHENWNRPKAKVDFLMASIEGLIHDNVAEFLRERIRLRVIGDRARLPASLQKAARDAEEATGSNSGLDLTLAVSYSGRTDIVAVGLLGALLHRHALA